MNRRDLLKMIVAATGTAFIGANAFAYELTFATPVSATGFSTADLLLLNDIGEVIIPATDTPGAKASDVASMMAIMVNDCYTQYEQDVFKAGLVDVQKRANAAYGKPFLPLSSEQKLSLLNALDAQAKEQGTKLKPHYFTMIKQQVLFCFFTSKVGATEALRHVAIPGRYDGEFPYKKGDKAWAV